MTFAVGFTWISATLLAFVHMSKNAIFLYEMVEEAGTIKFVEALELPPLCDGGSLNFAHCLSEQNPVFQPRTDTARSTDRLPPRFPFKCNAADGIACFVLGVSLEDIPGASVTIAIVVHRRALVQLASAAAAGADTVARAGEEKKEERPAVPWDSWGPSATRCLEVPYWRRCRGPSGQRWGMLAHDELVLHDFNPHNVRRASTQLRLSLAAPSTATATPMTGGVLRHENGNRTRVVTSPTLLTAGLCFRGDVMSYLPYVETRALCTPRWESVLTDGERLLGLYFKVCSIFLPRPPPSPHPGEQHDNSMATINAFPLPSVLSPAPSFRLDAGGGRGRAQGRHRRLSHGCLSLVGYCHGVQVLSGSVSL